MGSDQIVLRSKGFASFVWTAVVGFAVAAITLASAAPFVHMPFGNTLGAAAFLALSSVLFLPATRMRVVVESEGPVVFGYLSRTAISWPDMCEASAGYYGLRITRRYGEPVTAVCLGRPNWALWLHKAVAADHAAELLNKLAVEHADAPTQ